METVEGVAYVVGLRGVRGPDARAANPADLWRFTLEGGKDNGWVLTGNLHNLTRAIPVLKGIKPLIVAWL